jgi:flavin-dependent dehydrogenase
MNQVDVIVVGAGPSGAVAATVLARAGVRVRVLDRATFPRDKLCGDTVNPGTLAILRRLRMADGLETAGLRIDGMLVTGAGGQSIDGRYPNGLHGLSCARRDLDWLLLQDAIGAGVVFDEGVAVRGAVVGSRDGSPAVEGVRLGTNGSTHTLSAPVVIAADGRRSMLAFSLGLARHPVAPARWAIGAYFPSPAASNGVGEMHIRPGGYIGVAPLPGGVTNVCLVQPSQPGDRAFGNPAALLKTVLAGEPVLRTRFEGLDPVGRPVVLGPLAVDATGRAIDGLILAGDAAGFVDPMTGDGLRFAVAGGELAAGAALQALSHGWTGVHERLVRARWREFGAKWRFNRALRALVSSPFALRGATAVARVAPGVVRTLIVRAGDCSRTPEQSALSARV